MLAPSFETSFPPAVTEAATSGIEITLDSILGERPVRVSPAADTPEGPMLAAIISFIGEMKWSLTLMVTEPVGVALVERFCGLKLPFDGEDMADAIGEIVNVIAGEVTLQLEKRRMRGRMSLPTVVRGQALQLIANRSAASYRVAYHLSFGDFSVRFLAAGTSLFARLPGK